MTDMDTELGTSTRKNPNGASRQPLADLYRCPEEIFDFPGKGNCWGNSGVAFGPGAESKLLFNPCEVIDNLRLERYTDGDHFGGTVHGLLKAIYYRLRPFTTLPMRREIQKFRARQWRERAFPTWPVDTTVENICEQVLLSAMERKGLDAVPFIWFWPRGASGCAMMTHDVETSAGRDFCSTLMDLDDSFGIKSSFQIVPERRYSISQEFIEEIHQRGFEVGVQDLNHDGRLFDDYREFRRRAEKINQYGREYGARGFRSAVLYRRPEWYNALDFSFDMSIPNVAHLDPQRGGCCTVFPYFIGNMVELPVTTTQDYMLFHILDQRSIELWKTQLELILNKNGLASFIVHPDYVAEPGARGIYRELLGYLRDLVQDAGVWAALPREVDSWWRARSRMSIVKDGRGWSIRGEGSERAVLAFARNIQGRLQYEFASAATVA
jgi:hypothetical protein